MPGIIFAGLLALGLLTSPQAKDAGVKPCDAKTGCLHPAFK